MNKENKRAPGRPVGAKDKEPREQSDATKLRYRRRAAHVRADIALFQKRNPYFKQCVVHEIVALHYHLSVGMLLNIKYDRPAPTDPDQLYPHDWQYMGDKKPPAPPKKDDQIEQLKLFSKKI